MQKDIEVTNFTNHGECVSCGNCCVNFIPLTEKEIVRIKDFIVKNQIKEEEIRVSADGVYMFACPFRSDKCNIYEVRPKLCRDFKCDLPLKRLNRIKSKAHRGNKVYDLRKVFYGHTTGVENYLEGVEIKEDGEFLINGRNLNE